MEDESVIDEQANPAETAEAPPVVEDADDSAEEESAEIAAEREAARQKEDAARKAEWDKRAEEMRTEREAEGHKILDDWFETHWAEQRTIKPMHDRAVAALADLKARLGLHQRR